MPLGLLPALGNLTSLTNGGAFNAATPTTSGADSATGAVNVGGLNAPALPSQTNTIVFVAGTAFVVWLIFGRKR